MRRPEEVSYPLAILPAVLGIIAGVVISTLSPGDGPWAATYIRLPAYDLWRVIIAAQLGTYVAIASFMWYAPREAELPEIGPKELFGTIALTILVVAVPPVVEYARRYETVAPPLALQGERMQIVVAAGLFAMILVMTRVARVYVAFRECQDSETHRVLRGVSKDLLMITALVVTLATIGSGVFALSLSALAKASSSGLYGATRIYVSPMGDLQVIAYGCYHSVALFLFFTPLMVAERRAAIRLARAQPEAQGGDLESTLGLNVSLGEQVRSAFTVLSPLLGALVTQALS